MKVTALVTALVLTGAPAYAQLGGALGKLNKAADQAQKVKDLQVSEADERKIGEEVSATIRKEFGVYQNAAVTKYVTLVGTVLAQASARPNLKWEFVVLDTDGVNAFAAPGGIVHITRGALGLIKSEAELAGVLGHEVSHVSKKHTVNAIQKNRTVQLGTNAVAGSSEYVQAFAKATYDNIVERGFDRGDENDADQEGIRLANRAGYTPSGLATFLTKLMERNTGNADHNGLFASHPETQDRIDKIGKQIKSEKLAATATVAPRYAATIKFDVKPLAQITPVASGSKGLAGGSGANAKKEEPKKEEPKKRGLGLGLGSLSKGKQAESTQASASAGGRAVDTDRRAPGGDNPTKLTITVTPADLATFKTGIA
jgi:beta-barrel assembly-enhancing protease